MMLPKHIHGVTTDNYLFRISFINGRWTLTDLNDEDVHWQLDDAPPSILKTPLIDCNA